MNTKNTNNQSSTAEMVGCGHPDKACDQFGDSLLDALLTKSVAMGYNAKDIRSAIEVLSKGHRVILAGEVRAPEDVLDAIDFDAVIRECWSDVGYSDSEKLKILNFIEPQAVEIAAMIDAGGAGDQGIMVGAAFNDTPEHLPLEYAHARSLITALDSARIDGTLSYLGSDAKSQVSVDASGHIQSVIISTQHDAEVDLETLRADVLQRIVLPTVGDIDTSLVKINHKGTFVVGGTVADAGVLGRKVVVDALGPRVAVGGGAFSGKDPTKVDRCAAYQARQIAIAIIEDGFADAKSAVVSLAYGIGQFQPEAITAVTDNGKDVSDWVCTQFTDLSPSAIQERLGLWSTNGWSYRDTARAGHYGHSQFPWEKKPG